MDIRSVIRDHILSQIKKSKAKTLEDKHQDISFNKLSDADKRQLIAYEMTGVDGEDMLSNHEGPQLTTLLYSVYVKKNLSAEKALEFLMDAIVRRYASNMDERFEDEFQQYITEQSDNGQIYRSAERGHHSDAHGRV